MSDAHGELGKFSLVAREADSVLHVRFAGELTDVAVPEAQESLREPLSGRHTTVILNLQQVTFLDSAGLKLIVTTKRDIERHGGRLLISDPSPAVDRILRLTHLAEWFNQIAPEDPAVDRCPVCDRDLSPGARVCEGCGNSL